VHPPLYPDAVMCRNPDRKLTFERHSEGYGVSVLRGAGYGRVEGLITYGVSFTLMPLSIRRLYGQGSSSFRPSPNKQHPAICYRIEIRFMEKDSKTA
jgi:hypothetical protein